MRLVLRRAAEAKGLLLAAGTAALVATALVTILAVYNGQVLAAGKHSVVGNATAAERSVLITGPIGVDENQYAQRDAAVRAAVADGLGGLPVTISAARYGTGRQLTGDLGEFTPSDGEMVFASLVTLESLPEHADLRAGSWPQPGGTPLQVALPDRIASQLGVTVGDRIPLTDRATEQRSEVTVVGLWQPRKLDEAYWRLTPEVAVEGSASTIGPFVIDPADFRRVFPGSTSAGWVVEPDLAVATVAQIEQAGQDAETLAEQLPKQAGFGSSGQVATLLNLLVDRLSRADLVGRSALLTPVLLVAILGGYALILVAALLSEDRRAQIALLRARGASRSQIAGLAVREAAFVVLPAVLLAPLLADQALSYASRSPALADLGLGPRPGSAAWLVAGVAAVGCLLALLGPALRRGGTYLEDLTARSRPNRWAAAQRASIDLALVGMAVLAWFQLRQYSSPLAGATGGIDPLLAAAPTLGVLGGAVIALRLLPPVTRLVERLVTRRSWTATVFGMWQAGRRPHAGPVLLLALAVGGSTLAWSLVATWERSLTDQATHRVGADVRVIEEEWFAPAERAGQLGALPGVQAVLPTWHHEVTVGANNTRVVVVAVDAAVAPYVVRLNESLVDESPAALFKRLAEARPTAPGTDLPADTRRLTGTLSTPARDDAPRRTVTVDLLLSTADGLVYRLPLGSMANDGSRHRFAVDLPDSGGRLLRIAGFRVDTPLAAMSYGFELTDLQAVRVDGTAAPVDLSADTWKMTDGEINAQATASATGLSGTFKLPGELEDYLFFAAPVSFSVVREHPRVEVPAVVTPDLLGELSVQVGETIPLILPAGPVDIRIVGVMDAVPTTDGTQPAILLDLPSAVTDRLHAAGQFRPPSQWWIATEPGQHDTAVAAARDLPGVTVLDRYAAETEADRDPYWSGARTALLVAALGAALLAVVGLAVDVWATARRRLSELAVLHTLGATPPLLARALVAEQAFLAGIGVTVGLIVGAGVGATMAPLVILTPSANRPVPAPVLELAWAPIGVTAGALLVVAMTLSGFVAVTIRRRVAAAQLRIGADR